jgi:hypothetical protein
MRCKYLSTVMRGSKVGSWNTYSTYNYQKFSQSVPTSWLKGLIVVVPVPAMDSKLSSSLQPTSAPLPMQKTTHMKSVSSNNLTFTFHVAFGQLAALAIGEETAQQCTRSP